MGLRDASIPVMVHLVSMGSLFPWPASTGCPQTPCVPLSQLAHANSTLADYQCGISPELHVNLETCECGFVRLQMFSFVLMII